MRCIELGGKRSRVLVVSGDRRLRTSLVRILERGSFAAEEVVDGRGALRRARSSAPAVVVADVALPDVHGFEICRALREEHGEELAIVLVSSDQVERHDWIAGLLLGADEYLATPIDESELLVRLRRLVARAAARRRAPERNGNGSVDLTPRELEVLTLLVRGYTAGEIARTLVISPKTVASHLQNVMSKLGVHSRAQAVARAYEMGLIPVGDFEAHLLAGDEAPRLAS